MSSETILQETVAQLNAAREQLEQLQKSNIELESKVKGFVTQLDQFSTIHNMSFTSYISLDLSNPKAVEISGIALSEGTWNGIFYPADEIMKIAKSLVGAPMLVEHGKSSFGNREVGKFTECKWEPMIEALLYKALVTDPEAIAMVMAKKLPAVSMSNQLYYYPFEGKIMAKGLNLVEGSLVAVPACQTCYISKTKECLSKLYGNSFKPSVADSDTVEVNIMENKITYLSEQEYSKDFPEVFNLKVEELNSIFEVLAPGKMKFIRQEVVENAEKNKVNRYFYKLTATETPAVVGKKTLSYVKNGVSSVIEFNLTAENIKAELAEFAETVKGIGIPEMVKCPTCGMGFTSKEVEAEHAKTHSFTAGSGIPMQAVAPKTLVMPAPTAEITAPPAPQVITDPSSMFKATGGSQAGNMSEASVTKADPTMASNAAKCTCGKPDCKECNPDKATDKANPFEKKEDKEDKKELTVEETPVKVPDQPVVQDGQTPTMASLGKISEGEAILEIIKRSRR